MFLEFSFVLRHGVCLLVLHTPRYLDNFSSTQCQDWNSTCENAGEGLQGDGTKSKDQTCGACEAGEFASTSNNECIACPAGSITDTLVETNGTTCNECPMGKFSTVSTTACEEWLSTCSNEGEGLIGGSTSENRTCAPCRAGQYASSSDDECIVCLPGSETDTHNRDGATTCVECPIGKINNSSEEFLYSISLSK